MQALMHHRLAVRGSYKRCMELVDERPVWHPRTKLLQALTLTLNSCWHSCSHKTAAGTHGAGTSALLTLRFATPSAHLWAAR